MTKKHAGLDSTRIGSSANVGGLVLIFGSAARRSDPTAWLRRQAKGSRADAPRGVPANEDGRARRRPGAPSPRHVSVLTEVR